VNNTDFIIICSTAEERDEAGKFISELTGAKIGALFSFNVGISYHYNSVTGFMAPPEDRKAYLFKDRHILAQDYNKDKPSPEKIKMNIKDIIIEISTKEEQLAAIEFLKKVGGNLDLFAGLNNSWVGKTDYKYLSIDSSSLVAGYSHLDHSDINNKPVYKFSQIPEILLQLTKLDKIIHLTFTGRECSVSKDKVVIGCKVFSLNQVKEWLAKVKTAKAQALPPAITVDKVLIETSSKEEKIAAHAFFVSHGAKPYSPDVETFVSPVFDRYKYVGFYGLLVGAYDNTLNQNKIVYHFHDIHKLLLDLNRNSLPEPFKVNNVFGSTQVYPEGKRVNYAESSGGSYNISYEDIDKLEKAVTDIEK